MTVNKASDWLIHDLGTVIERTMSYYRGNWDLTYKNNKALKIVEIVEGCPILRQIYAWHCIVFTSHNNTVQKHNNKE